MVGITNAIDPFDQGSETSIRTASGSISPFQQSLADEAAGGGPNSCALTPGQARAIITEVAAATATWRDTAKTVGALPPEIARMASALEHDELTGAFAV